MPKKRRRGRMMIRRKSRPVEATTSAPKAVAAASKQTDGGEGFTARNSIDFFGNDEFSDFIPDDELRLSDELYGEYVEAYGEQVAADSKPTLDAIAKLNNTVSRL